ncbi:MAG: CBS domain-containing protein [Bdellovibrionota bacterium]
MEFDQVSYKSLQKEIKYFLRDNTLIVEPDQNILQTLKLMKDQNRGCVLVVKTGQVLGIFTERDVLDKIARPGIDARDLQIGYLMTLSPEVLQDTDTLAFALNKMAVGGFRHVPIQRENGGFAVLSVRDVVQSFLS